MNETKLPNLASEAGPESGNKQRSSRRRRKVSSSGISTKIKSVTIIAAVIGAIGAIIAALIGGFFLLIQPLAERIIDEYWNRTSEIQITDVRFAEMAGSPTIDVVLWNSTQVTQAVVSVEVGFAQEGLPLAMIAKSVYRLNGELVMTRSVRVREFRAIRGTVHTEDQVVYPFDGILEAHARGAWTLLLTIPVREELMPGESRSILFVVPTTIVVTRSRDWITKWLPVSSISSWDDKYILGAKGNEFTLLEFLKGRGKTAVRIRAKRGDGKTAVYSGSFTF